MIKYEKFQLDNGLTVIAHEDYSTPMAVLNVMYDVGSRDENPDKTGFAHLFEHLMFGGSVNIEEFDEELQIAGGENNAYTSPDVTNYYITIPADNIETAFWAESDRMLSLSFNPEVLEVQRKVVIEEFKQVYLNKPYGDVWLHMRELAYTTHPYRWPTIGKEISHIEKATMEDVKAFFATHYLPNNAVLVIGGPISTSETKRLAEKWFGPIPAKEIPTRNLPKEPRQIEKRTKVVESKVPLDAIYKAYHMCNRLHEDFFASDILADVLGRDKSSRLYQRLVQEKKLMGSISTYITGSSDEGLLVISGKLKEGVSFEMVEAEINKVIEELVMEGVSDEELFKLRNQAETGLLYEQLELLERCMSLASATVLGDTELANKELEDMTKVTKEQLLKVAKEVLREENSNVIYYKAIK